MNIFKICLIATIPLAFLFGCDKDDNSSGPNAGMEMNPDSTEVLLDTLSGFVIDAYTGSPVSNAIVTILDNNLEATTDSNGRFIYSFEDNTDLPEGTYSISLNHPDYRPLELNANSEPNDQYKMVPFEGAIFNYNQPVQLNDGLETGTIQDANLDIELIQGLMDKLYSNGLPEIHSVLIYKNNKLVLEDYFYGNNDTIDFENDVVVDKSPAQIQWSRTEEHYVASVNKALTSTLIGIALHEADLSINDHISTFLPEFAQHFNNPFKGAIQFEHCLNMTAGLDWDEWSDDDLKRLWKSDDFADFVLSRNTVGPGVQWRYNSALPNLLLKALETITEQNPREWANENFYQKLGITDYKWQSQPDGYPEGAARMYLRPRDMIKIGATYLNNGIWNEEQVIPQSYVEDCFTVKENTSAGDYSNYFWHRELDGVKYYSADGDGGNYINIFPEQNMVIVITQGNYLTWPLYVNQADDMMRNYIIPAVHQ